MARMPASVSPPPSVEWDFYCHTAHGCGAILILAIAAFLIEFPLQRICRFDIRGGPMHVSSGKPAEKA